MDEKRVSKSAKEVSNEQQRVKISFVEPKKTQPVKKVEEPKKIVKKQKPKPIKKKIEKPKKIVKKIEPKKKIVKEEVKPEPKKVEEQKVVQNIVQQKTIAAKALKKNKTVDAKTIEKMQLNYFATVSEIINKNKSYPKRAVLRHMQDDVKVQFMISPMGELISFDILEGLKIFHKSARLAIEKSFPIQPPRGILKTNTTVSLILSYRLN